MQQVFATAQKECIDSLFSQVWGPVLVTLFFVAQLLFQQGLQALYSIISLSFYLCYYARKKHINSTWLFIISTSLQNSFISYDTLNKLGISQPVQFLQVLYLFHFGFAFLNFGFFSQLGIGFMWSMIIYLSSSCLIKILVLHSNLVQVSWRYTYDYCICSPILDWDVGCCCWGCHWAW